MNKYTDNDFKIAQKEYRKLCIKQNRIIASIDDLLKNNLKLPFRAITYHYEKWTTFQEKSLKGLHLQVRTTRLTQKDYTDTQELYKDLSIKKGRPLTGPQFNKKMNICLKSVVDKYGSWKIFVQKCGFEMYRKQFNLELCKKQFLQLHDKLKRIPTKDQCQQYFTSSTKTVSMRFDNTWKPFVQYCGFQTIEIRDYTNVSDQQLIFELLEVCKQKGRIITNVQCNEFLFSTKIIKKRFGSWLKMLEKAGIKVSRGISVLQRDIFNKIQSDYSHFTILSKDRKTLPSRLELDIYIPSLNVAIQINGPTHYRPIYGIETFNKMKIRDKLKKKECKKLGIKLYSINSELKSFSGTYGHMNKQLNELYFKQFYEKIHNIIDLKQKQLKLSLNNMYNNTEN